MSRSDVLLPCRTVEPGSWRWQRAVTCARTPLARAASACFDPTSRQRPRIVTRVTRQARASSRQDVRPGQIAVFATPGYGPKPRSRACTRCCNIHAWRGRCLRAGAAGEQLRSGPRDASGVDPSRPNRPAPLRPEGAPKGPQLHRRYNLQRQLVQGVLLTGVLQDAG